VTTHPPTELSGVLTRQTDRGWFASYVERASSWRA
jgi:hypothetical protein